MRRWSSLCAVILSVSLPNLSSADSVESHLRSPEKLLQTNCPSAATLLSKKFFTICYHKKWRIALWVAYHLTRVDLEGDVERTEDFREDDELPESARSKLKDYAGSGYHRGHMAPADAFDKSHISMSTTFLLSNMAPQTASLNSGKWRSLESRIRKVIDAHRGAWIFTGNLFAKERRSSGRRTFTVVDPLARSIRSKRNWIGNGRVAVPTHSYKVILVARSNGTFAGYGFVLPNQRTRLPFKVPEYQVSIDQIEDILKEQVGETIDFFAEIPSDEQDRLEADTPYWPPRRERRR